MANLKLPLYKLPKGEVIDLRNVTEIDEIKEASQWSPIHFIIFLKNREDPIGVYVDQIDKESNDPRWLELEREELIKAWESALQGSDASV